MVVPTHTEQGRATDQKMLSPITFLSPLSLIAAKYGKTVTGNKKIIAVQHYWLSPYGLRWPAAPECRLNKTLTSFQRGLIDWSVTRIFSWPPFDVHAVRISASVAAGFCL